MKRHNTRFLTIAATAMMFAVVIGIPAQDMPRPAIPSTGLIGYLASPRAREFRKHSNHPLIQQLNRWLGEPVNDEAGETPEVDSASVPVAASADAVSSSCGVETGTRFNIEPRTAPAVAPQNEPTVDFLPAAGLNGADLVVGTGNDTRGLFNSLGDSTTGYYVHRDGASSNPCSPDFEGGLPSFRMRLEMLVGSGDPAVDADPARNAIYLVDTRMGSRGTSAIGLFRNTADRLNNTLMCPNGTHSGNAANICWNTRTAVSARTDALSIFPQVAVDQRPNGSGTGAGDVYVSNLLSTPAGVFVVLTACNNALSSCSQSAIISGADLTAQITHVRVRPDGGMTVVYVNRQEGPAPDFLQLYDIKYVTCTPAGAPVAPTCAAPKLIVREDQPIPSRGGGLGGGSLAVSNFLITTFPKHDHRVGTNGVETYVVWDRCKVQNIQGGGVCPDSDIRYALSTNNGTSWSFGAVDTNTGDQYFPAIRTDSSNVLNIAYMSAQNDAGLNHRSQVLLKQIPVGLTPDQVTTAVVITSTAMEPSADFFFGDAYIGNYIGVAARMTPTGRHAYVHHTHTIVNGVYNGVSAPEQNNHLSRFDY